VISIEESNNLIEPPKGLTDEERAVWLEFIEILKGARYRKTLADVELVRQYVQHRLMRDEAWRQWSERPERYIRIVTGISSDGVTPKVIVKENEHYRILNDCNKYLEKILTNLKLTPLKRL